MKLEVPHFAALIDRDDVCIVDVRSATEYRDDGHLPGAINIPVQTILAHVDSLAGYASIACICATGTRSQSAVRLLRSAGMAHVYDIVGGYAALHEAECVVSPGVVPA
jgi:rhodanese-related sulfurtransferase